MNRTRAKSGFRTKALAGAICLVLWAVCSAWAGDHWLSGDFAPDGGRYPSGMPRPAPAQGDAARTGAGPVDVVIHLDANPTGDNDITTLDQRTPYEKIIQYFADGVYEESNGAHKLRNVKIYTKGKYSGNCDILWKASGGPCSDPAGRGKACNEGVGPSQIDVRCIHRGGPM